MNQELLKKRLQNNLNRVVAEFQAREDIICRFENPRIAYVDAEDTRFDALFARGYNDHPKKIYRPGKSIVVHYTPYTKEFVEMCEKSKEPSKEWVRANMESLWLAMVLNREIVKTLGEVGRLTSYLNTMLEWDPKTCREEWSHKLAAAIGGLGKMGPAGSLISEGRYGGRASGIITDGLYAEPAPEFSEEEITEEIRKLTEPWLYDGPCSTEMVEACPAGAISEKGIDKFKCQDYCRNLNESTPMPEVCGRCFRFGK
ncbi:MAG: hypothetical protein MR892_00470 [Clostridiales bacterium]|nr:hypothetical protein [Clostridiales bacterium]